MTVQVTCPQNEVGVMEYLMLAKFCVDFHCGLFFNGSILFLHFTMSKYCSSEYLEC